MSKRKAKANEAGTKVVGTTSGRPHDGSRGRIGVLASLVRRPDGKLRLVLEDAQSVGEGLWAPRTHFTYRDYPADALMDTDIDRAEFESIGISLLSRLARQTKLNEE
ncbi:MAG TPA: hypothetical protein VEB43_04585 [Anaeromyxobacter sp.]|nr:hypothetical protein [Anaeromyxobacter sp.]